MRLQTIIIFNRAPFKNLRIELAKDNITLLSGINGAGKTTIISYIVDSFYELARKAYQEEFADKLNKYYRISSDLFSLDGSKPSIVYLRYSLDEKRTADYVDIRGDIEQNEYEKVIYFSDRIPYSSIVSNIKQSNNVKKWTITEDKTIQELFSSNLMTYFPAYRYEKPYYLNDSYDVKLEFSKDMSFTGNLDNPIEVVSDLPQIANWIMDVVLDNELYPGSSNVLFGQINDVLTGILESKVGERTRVGIGMRNYGASRIAVMARDINGVRIYPSIFNMSSGELSLLCLFAELIKQADKIRKTIGSVSGIVLIDEIEKHLHIQLQKEVLPKLIKMFPHIQFIASSHSPFLGLGLEETDKLSYNILDLDNGGIICPPQDNELFREVYDMMIHQNDQFFEKYKQLHATINKNSKPIIVTEGKTDWKHIKAAMKALNIHDLDIEIYEYQDTIGDTKLKEMLEDFSRIQQPRTVIGMFDRDNLQALGLDSLNLSEFNNLGNNVYCFPIPEVNTKEYGKEISIEHYYLRQNLTKPDTFGRRIFVGDEFYPSGMSKDGKYHARCKEIQKKAGRCGIVDEKVFVIATDPEEEHSVALSKNGFAELVLNDCSFTEEFDFTNFNKIFEIIRKIINSVNATEKITNE